MVSPLRSNQRKFKNISGMFRVLSGSVVRESEFTYLLPVSVVFSSSSGLVYTNLCSLLLTIIYFFYPLLGGFSLFK